MIWRVPCDGGGDLEQFSMVIIKKYSNPPRPLASGRVDFRAYILVNPNPQSLGRGLTPSLPFPEASARRADRPSEPVAPLLGPFGSPLGGFGVILELIFGFLFTPIFVFSEKKLKNHCLVLISSNFAAKHQKIHSSVYEKTVKNLRKTIGFQ